MIQVFGLFKFVFRVIRSFQTSARRTLSQPFLMVSKGKAWKLKAKRKKRVRALSFEQAVILTELVTCIECGLQRNFPPKKKKNKNE